MVPLFYDCVVFNGGGFWFLVFDCFFNKKGGGSMYLVLWYRGRGPQYYTVVGSLKFSFKKERGKRAKSF